MKSKTPIDSLSFNDRLIELEKIYHLIQSNEDNNLEKMITLYEDGMKLAQSLEKNIQEYELRIEQVKEGDVSSDEIHQESSTKSSTQEKQKINKKNTKKENISEEEDSTSLF